MAAAAKKVMKSESLESIENLKDNTNMLTAHFDNFATIVASNESKCELENKQAISKDLLIAIGLADENERINLTTFRRIIFENLNIDGSFLYRRVFNAFDVEQKGYLTTKQLISLLVILLHGPFEAQVDLALRVYGKPIGRKLDQRSFHFSPYVISKSDAIDCIVESLQLSTPRTRHTLTTTSREKARKVGEDLVDLVFPKLDADKDGVISYDDFLKACEEDETLVQVFGQFLPKTIIVAPSRPATPAPLPGKVGDRPWSSGNVTTFEGVDYLKHSPTLSMMWGKKGQGQTNVANCGSSERLEPIPILNKEKKLKPKSKSNKQTVKKKVVRSSKN